MIFKPLTEPISRDLEQKVDRLSTFVGNTPIRELRLGDDRSILIKEEGCNPAGSIKDRPALNMVLRAIKQGLIGPETVVAESTSGNTGIGVAWVCSELGLEYHNYSPSTLSAHKRALLDRFGAKFHYAEGGTDDATNLLKADMDANPGYYFWTSQFTNEHNWRAHTENTAPELLKQVPHVDEVWVAFGSGGTSTGFANALQHSPVNLRVVQNTRERARRVEGMRNLAWISKPPIADLDLIGPENMFDTDPDTLLDIAKGIYERNEGFIVGPTTAAILTQAVKSEASTVVVVSPDNGWRYPKWVEQVTQG